MRILGVSVLGLLELTACWREREGACHMVNPETAATFEDWLRLQDAPPVELDASRESAAPANGRRQERG